MLQITTHSEAQKQQKFILIILEARNPKARGQQSCPLSLKAPEKNPSLPLPASGGPQASLGLGYITLISASVSTFVVQISLCLSLLRTLVIGFKGTLIPE